MMAGLAIFAAIVVVFTLALVDEARRARRESPVTDPRLPFLLMTISADASAFVEAMRKVEATIERARRAFPFYEEAAE